MSKLSTARAALADGGLPELTRRSRLWLAGLIYPGTMPAPRKGKKGRGRNRPAPVRATEVSHARALAWFEGRREVYDRLAAAAAPYVASEDTILDIGANIGYFTKVLGETVGFRGHAHLFEPVPNLARLCAQTLAGAPYRTTVHDFGLSDADAELEIFVSGDGNLGWNTIVAEKASAAMVPVTIAVRRFSGVTGIEPPSFVKIDVEGAEHRVLSGMIEVLGTWPRLPVILCEIGWGQGHPQWEEELTVFARLEALGYRVVDLDGAPVDPAGITRTTDVLFLPAESGPSLS